MKIFERNGLKALTLPLSIAAIFVGALSLQACSAEPTVQTATPSDAEKYTIKHTIKSQHAEQDRILSVQLPGSYYDQPDKRYPVLYILDGNQNLELTGAVVKSLVDAGKTPELIIVGLHAGNTRGKDYLPNMRDPDSNTGAKRFLGHVEKEVLPFVGGHYRTSSYQLLSGHSWGALFTTYAMIEKPNLFDGYLAQSPNLNKRRREYYVTRMEKMLAQNPELEIAYYMTIGVERKLESGFDQLIALFEEKAPEIFHWKAIRLAGASHMQTRQPGTHDGLIHIFAEK